MEHQPPALFPELIHFLETLEATHLPKDRLDALDPLVSYLKANNSSPIHLNFICTHNSRRSQFAQVWATVIAGYLGISNLTSWSGGTEATAMALPVGQALERAGLKWEKGTGENPVQRFHFGVGFSPVECFSKTFSDAYNPQENFVAVMTCSEADQACPWVPGASKRIALPYRDPKIADHTPEEAATYDERSRQIAQEMLYVLRNGIEIN